MLINLISFGSLIWTCAGYEICKKIVRRKNNRNNLANQILECLWSKICKNFQLFWWLLYLRLWMNGFCWKFQNRCNKNVHEKERWGRQEWFWGHHTNEREWTKMNKDWRNGQIKGNISTPLHFHVFDTSKSNNNLLLTTRLFQNSWNISYIHVKWSCRANKISTVL